MDLSYRRVSSCFFIETFFVYHVFSLCFIYNMTLSFTCFHENLETSSISRSVPYSTNVLPLQVEQSQPHLPSSLQRLESQELLVGLHQLSRVRASRRSPQQLVWQLPRAAWAAWAHLRKVRTHTCAQLSQPVNPQSACWAPQHPRAARTCWRRLWTTGSPS